MNRHLFLGSVVAAFSLIPTGVVKADALSTAFTYQGRIELLGEPVNDTADFDFTLWDAEVDGNQVGSLVTVEDVGIVDGLFTVRIDFGVEVFNGEARWLEIDVRSPAGSGEFTTLSPRQPVTATPYALQTRGFFVDQVGNVGIGTTSPGSPLTVAGEIESTDGGFKFPDGSVQATAAGSGLWFPIGEDIFYTAGSVGIGTTDPFLPGGDTLVKTAATLPSVNSGLACAADPATGKIYCFGGYDGVTYSDEILEYDPATPDVNPVIVATLATPRGAMECAASTATGKIYCFGGYDENTGFLAEILEYDPANPDVAPVPMTATLPQGRVELACAADPATGRIYLFGGADGSKHRDEILEYDPDYPYEPGAVLPVVAYLPSGRNGLSCAPDPATGKIYCFGGYDGTTFDQILEYDPGANTVNDELNAALPSGRHGLACCADPASGKIYCFGGRELDYTAPLNQIIEYDPGVDTLAIMSAELPSENSDLACAPDPATGKIYCFGGWDGSTRLDEILQYNPTAQTLLQVGEPGDGTGAIANTWSVFSSRTFKRDIAALESPDYQDILTKLKATDVVRYRYADDTRRTLHLGVIAEDSPAEILTPGGKAVSLGDYTTFLMAAIKAQQAEIEAQQALNEEMECQFIDIQARLAETKSHMARLEAIVGESTNNEDGGV